MFVFVCLMFRQNKFKKRNHFFSVFVPSRNSFPKLNSQINRKIKEQKEGNLLFKPVRKVSESLDLNAFFKK